jgi:eukaryotic-like serine/threonine-protein kinase
MTQPPKGSALTHGSDPVLDDLLEELAEKLHAGEPVDVEEYLRRLPERADEIRQLLPALEMLADLGHSAARNALPGSLAGREPVQRPRVLGDFRLIREVARGGMGVVYEAEQISLVRRVALKVLPFAGAIDPKQLHRFQNEAQAAAQLHHTNIVPVYAVGCERGVHYYAMQFIDGQTLADAIRGLRQLAGLDPVDPSGLTQVRPELSGYPGSGDRAGKDPIPASSEADAAYSGFREPASTTRSSPHQPSTLSTEASARGSAYFREVAQLGIQAAEALEHAHALGVLHRDIKPANLLLDVRGNLWITDFGLARFQSEPSWTMTGDLLGTLRYMSPEQALAKRVVIDHRTDVYSLGVTLYELLTLEPAFGGRDRQELLRQIAFEEPRPARKINRAVPVELETIVLKAISKNPDERYSSAQELADDLNHYLEYKPISARRPSLFQRVSKWARRHKPVVVSAGVSTAVLLVTAVIALAVSNRLISSERDKKDLALHQKEQALAALEDKELAARRYLYSAHMNLALQAWESGNIAYVQQLLEQHWPEQGEADLRCFEWYYLWRLSHYPDEVSLRGHSREVSTLEFSPDGQTLASGSADGSVKLWDTRQWHARTTLRNEMGPVTSVAFSPDGRTLASAATGPENPAAVVTLWDVAKGRVRGALPGQAGDVYHVAFSPNGQTLAVQSAEATKLWETQSLALLGVLQGPEGTGHGLAFSPDGQTLATGDSVSGVRLWNLAAVRERALLKGHRSHVITLAFTADGKTLASAGNDWLLRLWDTATQQERATFDGQSGGVESVAFARDGKTFATANAYRFLILWDLARGKVRVQGYPDGLHVVTFSPDGKTLAFGSDDGTIRLWDTAGARSPASVLGRSGQAITAAFSPDSLTLASAGRDGVVRLWDVATGRTQATLKGGAEPIRALAYSPDGSLLATAGSSGTVTLWNLATQREWALLRGHQGRVTSLAFAPEGKTLASGGSDQTVTLWDVPARRQQATVRQGQGEISSVAFSRDGRLLASGSERGHLMLWNVASEQVYADLSLPVGVLSLAFAPDSKTIASAHAGGSLLVWDIASKQQSLALKGHLFSPRSVAYFPDGKTLASGGVDGTLKLWDLATGQARATFKIAEGTISCVAVSPDGKTLATVNPDGTVKLWRSGETRAGRCLRARPRSSRQKTRRTSQSATRRSTATRSRCRTASPGR